MKPKTGATLVECDFCGSKHRPLEWKDGTGWVCQVCETGVNGKGPRDER